MNGAHAQNDIDKIKIGLNLIKEALESIVEHNDLKLYDTDAMFYEEIQDQNKIGDKLMKKQKDHLIKINKLLNELK